MNSSDNLDQLIPALVKARSGFTHVVKDKTAKAGTFTYNYADLASVLDAVVPALVENGLVLIQPITFNGDHMILGTRLLHASGQWLGGACAIPHFAKAQDLGSFLTYMRRYSACALLGIVAEDDDDGAAASQDAPKPKARAKADPAPANAPTAPVGGQEGSPAAITEQQRAELRDHAKTVFGSRYVEDIKRIIRDLTGKEDSRRLDQSEFKLVKTALQHHADKMVSEGETL